MKTQFKIDEKYLDKIISTAYGDGSLFDRIDVYFRAFSNPSIKKILRDYKSTSKVVRNISREYASNIFIKNVQRDAKARDNFFISSLAGLFEFLTEKPLYSAAAAIIILSISTFLLFHQPKQEPEYSKTQVALAEKQLKESFALVGRILDRTQNKITNEVIVKDVAHPIRRGTAAINNLFNGG